MHGWFIDMAIRFMEEATTKRTSGGQPNPDARTLKQLGKDLHEHVKRDDREKPFSHSLLSRVMNRKVGVTLDLINALVHEFTDLPFPVWFPATREEALAIMHTVAVYRGGPALEILNQRPEAPVVAIPKPTRTPKASGAITPVAKLGPKKVGGDRR